MDSIFSITTATDSIPIGKQRSATVTFTVTNRSGHPITGRSVLVMGAPNETHSDWLKLPPPQKSERHFDINGVENYSVEVDVPVGAPAGEYVFHLDMLDTDRPDETYTVGPTVKLQVAAPEKEKKPFPWWIIAVAVGVLAVIGVAAFFLWPRPINKAAERIDQAIVELNNNPAGWQAVMNSLVNDLNKIEKNVANDAQVIATRATPVAGVEFRCNADFVGKRVKEDLERLSAKLRGNTPSPVEPVVCQLAFDPPQSDQTHINMASVPDQVLFYGYNFDAASPAAPELVLKNSGGDLSLKQWTTQPTHYLLTLNTAKSDGVQMCNLNDRSIVLRWNGRELSSLGVIANVCPTPIPPPTPLPERNLPGTPLIDRTEGRSLGVTLVDKTYGGRCSNGYVRSSFQSITIDKGGKALVHIDWMDANDNKNCTIRALYTLESTNIFGSLTFLEVSIIIKETGEQLPAPQTPPCTCR